MYMFLINKKQFNYQYIVFPTLQAVNMTAFKNQTNQIAGGNRQQQSCLPNLQLHVPYYSDGINPSMNYSAVLSQIQEKEVRTGVGG